MHIKSMCVIALLTSTAVSGCASALTEPVDVTIRGKVIDASDSKPVGNASVESELLSTYTNFDGTFTLEARMVDEEEVEFRVRKKGYHSTLATATVGGEDVDLGTITLTGDKSAWTGF